MSFGHCIWLVTSVIEILSSGRLCNLLITQIACFYGVIFSFYRDFEHWHFLHLKCCDLSLLQFVFIISKSERTTFSCRNRELLCVKEYYRLLLTILEHNFEGREGSDLPNAGGRAIFKGGTVHSVNFCFKSLDPESNVGD